MSEPAVGTDVLGMKMSATKTKDGKHYILNGTKYVSVYPVERIVII